MSILQRFYLIKLRYNAYKVYKQGIDDTCKETIQFQNNVTWEVNLKLNWLNEICHFHIATHVVRESLFNVR